jgi:serine/threonine protein phosphatase PrpC
VGELRKYNNADLSQLAANIVKVSDNISEEIGRSSLKLQGDYKELKKNVNKLETLGRGQGVQKQIEKEMGKQFVSLQKDCKELRNDNSKLETLRDFLHLWKEFNEAQTQLKADLGGATDNNITCINGLSQEVINRIKENLLNNSENDIEKIIGNPREFQKARDELKEARDELKEAVDQLEALRSFNKMQTKIDANHIEGKNDENTRIDQLSNKIVEKFKKNLEPSDKQGIWNALKEAKTLWKVSHAWKQAHEVKAGYIDPLSEGNELKCYADIHIEDIDRQFRLFLSSFEQEYAESSASNCNAINCEELKRLQGGIEGNCKELKLRVLNDKWKKLVDSRKNLIKDQEDPTIFRLTEQEKKVLEHRCGSSQSLYHHFKYVPHSLLYDQLSLAWKNCDDAKAKKILVSHMAENIIHSYEFKDKTAKPSRRKQMWYGCKELFGKGQGECRSERVKRIADGFNKTLEDMKGKFAAADYLPKELKRKVLENIVTIMKDFEESCDAALRDYGKFKGGKARDRGEERIKELNGQLDTLSEAISIYKLNHEIQTESIEALRDPYKEKARNAKSEINSAFEQLLNQEGDWQSLKKSIEGAYGELEKMLHAKIEPDSEKVSIVGKETNGDTIIEEIDIKTEKLIVYEKGDIGEIASATTGKNEPNQDTCFIFKDGGGVCDGVGGEAGGDAASKKATEFFKEELSKLSKEVSNLSDEQIEGKLQEMTDKIHDDVKKDYTCGATTLSAVIPIRDGKMMAVNVGDSRVYVLRKNGQPELELDCITTDDGAFESDYAYTNQVQIDEYRQIINYVFTPKLYQELNSDILDKRDQKAIQDRIAKMSDDEFSNFQTKIKEEEALWRQWWQEQSSDKKNELKGQLDAIASRKSLEDLKIEFAIRCRHIISNSLGIGEVKPDIVTFKVNHGDMVIITSDGVHDNLSDEEMIKCVLTSKNAEEAAQALVKIAREKSLDKNCARHKKDDTTAVVIRCYGEVVQEKSGEEE